MELKIPLEAINKFKEVAISNYHNGEEVETLAYFLGLEENNCTKITTIVFPDQKGTPSYVDDKGIDEENSLQWILRNLVQSKGLTLGLWVHCHVNGAPCGFSSIDVHTQLTLQKLFPSIKGLVVEMNGENVITWKVFNLTRRGVSSISKCSKTRNVSCIQHEECSSLSFFQVFKDITCTHDEAKLHVIDKRKLQHQIKTHEVVKSVHLSTKEKNEQNTLNEQLLHTLQRLQEGTKT